MCLTFVVESFKICSVPRLGPKVAACVAVVLHGHCKATTHNKTQQLQIWKNLCIGNLLDQANNGIHQLIHTSHNIVSLQR